MSFAAPRRLSVSISLARRVVTIGGTSTACGGPPSRLAARKASIPPWCSSLFCSTMLPTQSSNERDEAIGPRTAAEWLRSLHIDEPTIAHMAGIIQDMSFKGAGVPTPMSAREGMVVQDVDRLDALGAIGIA